MNKIPEVDFDNMTCYELMGMKTSDDRCEEVVRAIRDTKLSIARELYDEKKVISTDIKSLFPESRHTFAYVFGTGRAKSLANHANRLALEALGWEGL